MDGHSGTDVLHAKSGLNSLTISGLGAGSIDANVSFFNFESILLGDGDDSAFVSSASALASVDGGAGLDTLNNELSGNTLVTNGFDSGVLGNVSYRGFEVVNMGDGSDKAFVRDELSMLDMGSGNDLVIISADAKGLIDGGDGVDLLVDELGDTIFVSNGDGQGSLNSVRYSNFESIDLGSGSDHASVSHNVGMNSLHFGSGDDSAVLSQDAGGRFVFDDGNDSVDLAFSPDRRQQDHVVLDGSQDLDLIVFSSLDLADVADLSRGGEMGDFTNYASDPTGETFDSDLFNLSATNFENVNWDKSSQDSNAVSDARLVGVSETTVDVDDDLTVDYDVSGNSESDATGVSIGASAYSELITIGVEDSDFDAADGVSFDLDFGGVSSASSSSTSEGSDAVAVGFGLGFDGLDGIAVTDANISGSELDLAISNVSGVMADAESIVGDVMAVSSNDIVDATELMVVADASVQAALSADVQTISIATTTAGSSEAVGWQDVSVLEDSSVTSGGLGLIDVYAQAMNSVSAESVGVDGVGGIVTADAISHTTGISETDFSFADTESSISADLSDSTSASATSVFGNVVSSLTSSIKGIFGGSSPNTIENAESISAIVNEQGFAEASSVGGTAVSTADQSAEAISSYDITTSEDLLLQGQSNLSSTTSSSVTEA